MGAAEEGRTQLSPAPLSCWGKALLVPWQPHGHAGFSPNDENRNSLYFTAESSDHDSTVGLIKKKHPRGGFAN